MEKSDREKRENVRSIVRDVGTVFAYDGYMPIFAIDRNVVVGTVFESMSHEKRH